MLTNGPHPSSVNGTLRTRANESTGSCYKWLIPRGVAQQCTESTGAYHDWLIPRGAAQQCTESTSAYHEWLIARGAAMQSSLSRRNLTATTSG